MQIETFAQHPGVVREQEIVQHQVQDNAAGLRTTREGMTGDGKWVNVEKMHRGCGWSELNFKHDVM